jgi:hypothetical protein
MFAQAAAVRYHSLQYHYQERRHSMLQWWLKHRRLVVVIAAVLVVCDPHTACNVATQYREICLLWYHWRQGRNWNDLER